MDEVWDSVCTSGGTMQSNAVQTFYQHPVWIVNGIFTEVDPASVGHREAIARQIGQLRPALVCDYGGGFGALARRIAALMPEVRIEVIEPYPHPAAQKLAGQYQNLAYVNKMPRHADVVIAQDVLEHVPNPIDLTAQLAASLGINGIFIAANCFQPVIKCHLPETFHLLQTYRHCVAPLGLRFSRAIPGADHAEIFIRDATAPDLTRAHRREWASQKLAPVSRKLQRWAAQLL